MKEAINTLQLIFTAIGGYIGFRIFFNVIVEFERFFALLARGNERFDISAGSIFKRIDDKTVERIEHCYSTGVFTFKKGNEILFGGNIVGNEFNYFGVDNIISQISVWDAEFTFKKID